MFSYHGNWSFASFPLPALSKRFCCCILYSLSVDHLICISLSVKMMLNKVRRKDIEIQRGYKTETGSIYRRYYETNENSFYALFVAGNCSIARYGCYRKE